MIPVVQLHSILGIAVLFSATLTGAAVAQTDGRTACGTGAGDCCSGNDTPGCNNEACCEAVCACDPFCCNVAWDHFCVFPGFDGDICPCGHGMCNASGHPECAYCFETPASPCTPDAGDCFVANGTPGCHDVACCEAVCACDAFCCDVIWDSWCATTGIGSGCGAALLDACNGGCPPLATSCPDCFGYCGRQSPDGCWCDDQCCAFLDCCDDKCEACGMDHGNCDNLGRCVELPLSCGNPSAGSCCSAADSPYCDDPECCEAVCACDPFCCEVQWDSFCAGVGFGFDSKCGAQNMAECNFCEDVPRPACNVNAGDCCTINGSPACDDPACCEMICAADPFCCNVTWDGRCANAANALCEVCRPEPPMGCGDPNAGSCCSATDSPYCDDPECCEAVCACDPFCCEIEWDSFCATHGFDADCLCGPSQCGGSNQPECAYCFVSNCESSAQDCCESSPTFQPGCNDPSCCDCVCNIFPQCCSMNWQAFCADIAMNACADECTCAQPPTGGEGCSLGFWKQPHHFEHWTNHHPDDSFDAVFSAGVFIGKSLHEVLSQPSGPPTPGEPPQLKNLGKQAVAALLNATSPEVSYNLSPSDVIALVQNAIASGSYNALKDELDALNNQGCPFTQPADLNTDGFINGHDLIILLGNWGKPGLGDINNDGLVDGHDLLELLAAWGT